MDGSSSVGYETDLLTAMADIVTQLAEECMLSRGPTLETLSPLWSLERTFPEEQSLSSTFIHTVSWILSSNLHFAKPWTFQLGYLPEGKSESAW